MLAALLLLALLPATLATAPTRVAAAGPFWASDFGSRANANALCAARTGCGAALLCFPGETLGAFPAAYGFNATAPVSYGGAQLAPSWPSWLSAGTAPLPNTLTGYLWTGCGHGGAAGLNCNGWTSTSATGALVNLAWSSGGGANWYAQGPYIVPSFFPSWMTGSMPSCAQQYHVLCVCA